MPKSSKKGPFFYLKAWIKQRQITIINSAVTVVLIGIIIFVLLGRASSMQRRTVEDSIVNLAGMTANEVQAFIMGYADITRIVSQIMQNYEIIERDQRRNFLNDTMQALIASNPSLINIYTLWKPNELDGRDAAYRNTPGSDENGQFVSGFSRRSGSIEGRNFEEFKYLLNREYIYTGQLNVSINEPVSQYLYGRPIYSTELQIPIFRDDTAVGIFGVTINLEQLQVLVEPIKPLITGQTMVCTNSGMIIAHNSATNRGINLLNFEGYSTFFTGNTPMAVYQAVSNSIQTLTPGTLIIDDIMLISYPLRLSNVLTGASSFTDFTNVSWTVVTLIPMSTITAPIDELYRFSIIFIFGAGVVAALAVFFTSASLTQHAHGLQRDLERATTMQDNLKYGLFMMDHKYVIQGVYSKALERILVVSNLQGKNFIDILSSSLKPQEREGLADYLQMIFKRSFDQEMLENINPINVFSYISNESGDTKSLRTSFNLAERGKGADFILVTLEDITAEKELEKQLMDAQNLREKEMQSIFQVIQLNPRVLSDFIEDTEFEFNKINEMLKSNTQFHRDVLVEIYQSIHAVKSNALILNLETFGNRLHKLETSIKELQNKYPDFVPFDDFLNLVLELDEAMKEKDDLRKAISKIQNFKALSGEEKNQDRYVLVETLTQVCKKTQAAMNKQVRFVVGEIDENVLSLGPRRFIKEVLTQLVRNAVYHGIEDPGERESLGKATEGEVRVSIQYIDNQVVLKCTDDGKGINFSKIKQTAETFNLFNSPEEVNDKNFLLQLLFSPGFSTLETADLHAGRGIGLNLVKDRVKEMNGNLKVSTVLGKGTTFTITIPLVLPVAVGNSESADSMTV